MIRLTIYSRPGCHLCDQMKAAVGRAARASVAAIEIEEIDISGNADLEALYGTEVPVLLVDGKKAAKYRIADDDLWKVLRARGAG